MIRTRAQEPGPARGSLHPAEPADPHPWRAALLLGLGVVLAGMAWANLILPHFYHHGWEEPLDIWHPMVAAHQVASGHIGNIYTPDLFYVAMPLFAVFLAPVAAIGHWLHLTEALPTDRLHPTLWLVYGPYGLGTAIPLLYAVRALAFQCGLRRRLVWVQVWAAVLVISQVAIEFGHYEDVLALAFVMLAARDVLRSRSVPAALWLGLGMATKQLAILALPPLVAMAPSGRRLRTAAWALALPAVAGGFELLTDWAHASKALFAAPTYPQAGHHALWVSARTGQLVGTPTRAGSLVLSLMLAWLLARRRAAGTVEPSTVLAALAVVFLSRVVFEPVLYSYYLGPGLAFLLLHERVARGTYRRTLVAGLAWLELFQWDRPLWAWWLASYALLVFLAWRAGAELVRELRLPADIPSPA